MLSWPFFKKKLEPIIRPLEPRWFGEATKLHRQFFARAWAVSDFEELLGDRQVLADGIFDGPGRSCFGFAISRLAGLEAELLSIVVDPRFQGRGWGQQLLVTHFSHLSAQGAQEVFLEVEQGNSPAIQLYQRFGFVQVGERLGYYPKKDGSRATALVMRAPLN